MACVPQLQHARNIDFSTGFRDADTKESERTLKKLLARCSYQITANHLCHVRGQEPASTEKPQGRQHVSHVNEATGMGIALLLCRVRGDRVEFDEFAQYFNDSWS